ncbi:guided entry of tail-anchored proteins factor CAMLG-like [Physella acuta]|uniref:guided entry of tail-anchored proteins factor CAMLG-like n=1 Tax=Physella acuta TaxID=109671 RepID=UPI0027DBAF04|nr:guided entry of tail-anchored proteins factor CAMLG-like [Physella acuta]
MADAAAQREARRKKILQNSEDRIKRIYGLNSNEGVAEQPIPTEQKNDEELLESSQPHYSLRNRHHKTVASPQISTHETPLINEPPVQPSLTGHNSSTFDDVPLTNFHNTLSDSLHNDENEAETNAVPESTTKINTNNKMSDFVMDSKSLEILKLSVFALTAFVSRFLLKFGFGLFLLQSIFYPFIFLEIAIAYTVHTYFQHIPVMQSKGNMMVAALMLCGIKQDILDSYTKIMAHVSLAVSDFCVYLFFFIFSHAVIK